MRLEWLCLMMVERPELMPFLPPPGLLETSFEDSEFTFFLFFFMGEECTLFLSA